MSIVDDPNFLYQKIPTTVFLLDGQMFDFANVDPDKIDIYDIAHGLANSCRYNGQTPSFYSVAEHSLNLVEFVKNRVQNPRSLMKAALLHDAAEAYMGDIVRPLKRLFPEFSAYEDNLLQIIFEKYGVKHEMKDIVQYDNEMTVLEIKKMFEDDHKSTFQIYYLSPYLAKLKFVKKFEELFS